MSKKQFPIIDMKATGNNIRRLRLRRKLTVKDVQAFFGFENPQAIYHWEKGKRMPSLDNMMALGALLDKPVEEIIIRAVYRLYLSDFQQDAKPGQTVIFGKKRASTVQKQCGFLFCYVSSYWKAG